MRALALTKLLHLQCACEFPVGAAAKWTGTQWGRAWQGVCSSPRFSGATRAAGPRAACKQQGLRQPQSQTQPVRGLLTFIFIQNTLAESVLMVCESDTCINF